MFYLWLKLTDMEEQILKIIEESWNNYYDETDTKYTVPEIVYHVMSFIKWILDENNETVFSTIYGENLDIKDVYLYWSSMSKMCDNYPKSVRFTEDPEEFFKK